MITSKDNARVKRWAKLVRDARLRREAQRVVVEGPHLVAEALLAQLEPLALLVSESGLARDEIRRLVGKAAPVVLSDPVFRSIADVEHPQGIAAEIAMPKIAAQGHCIFLEAVQDPSNVGAIVRTAAAFGVGEMILDGACADAWGPKALRTGMGGHFKLGIRQVGELESALDGFEGTLVCAVPAQGTSLRAAELKGRLGWIFGSEGRGISDAILRRAQLRVTIPMAASTESLNVAAAAAVCLYEAFQKINRPGAGS